MSNGFAPPLPAPDASYPIIHTPSTNQQLRQCEGVGGRFQSHCQQAGQMMPGFAYTPNLPPGFPAALAKPPCVSYCTMPSGDQSTYDDRTGSWNPPLTAMQGFGALEDVPESLVWKLAKGAIAFVVAYKIVQSMDKPAKTAKVAGWAAAGATMLFL